MTAGSAKSDPNHITNLGSAFYGSATLFAASDLGIFSELAHRRAAPAGQIADSLALNPRATALLLDACVAVGLLEKDGEVYRNSPDVDTYLVPGGMLDLSDTLRSSQGAYSAWGKLREFVRTGCPIDSSEQDSGRAPDFALSMRSRDALMGRAVIRRLDLQGRRTLLEVGGAGAFSALAALEFPQIHCTVLDLPQVGNQHGSGQRVTLLPGDYHTTPFPSGNDVVLFFGILHRESASSIQDLLRRAVESLNPGGLVYVLDMMTDETRTKPPVSAMFALNMGLTSSRGGVLCYTELQQWMETAGLKDFSVQLLPPPFPHWLARGRKSLPHDEF
jgi:hypothetical protein